MNKKCLAFLPFVLLLFSLAVSAQPKVEISDVLMTEPGVIGGELVLAVSQAPRAYLGIIDEVSRQIREDITDPLIEDNAVTHELEPALAESWEVSADGKEVMFHLRKGVLWSDGEPFTADDVVFTLNHYYLDPTNPSNHLARYTIGGKVIEFSKVDDYTVKAILPSPYGAFFRVLTQVRMLPKHKLANFIPALNPQAKEGAISNAWTTDTPFEDIVGTGPFKIAQYVIDQKVVLERNPYYWRVDTEGIQLPYIDKLVYLVVPNAQVQQAKFLAGEIDYLVITPQMYPTLKKEEIGGAGFRVFKGSPVNPTPSPPHWAFNFDVQDPELRSVFRDDRFREAMAYAIDTERVLDEVYNTLAIEPGMPVLPSNKAFFNPEIEEYRIEFDLEKAAQLLDELGIKDKNGDGARELPSGKRFEFTLTTAVDKQQHSDIATLLRTSLEEIGVTLHLQFISNSLCMDKGLAGDFESMILAFGNQPDPQLRKAIWQPGRSLYYWHLSTMSGKEQVPVKEEMFDWELQVFEDFEKGEVTMDPAARKAYYDEWQLLYAKHLPVIFIAKGMDLSAAQNTVGNVFQTEQSVTVFSKYTVFKR